MLDDNNINKNEDYAQQQAPSEAPSAEPVNPYTYIPEEYRQKADIRRLALVVGIPIICLTLISYLWKYVYMLFSIHVFGMSAYDSVAFLQNPATQQILQIVLSCFMFLVPFAIAAKCAHINIDETVQFSPAKKGTFLPYVFFGMGFCAFANVATTYVSAFFNTVVGEEYNVPDLPNAEGFFGFLLSFISTAIVPALVEEFACRGIVLGVLKKYGQGFAIVTSSIVFGVMHGNFDQMPFATLVGLILGYIYVKTESIWPCVLVHGINNSISVIFSYMPASINADIQNIIYMVYLILCMVVAIVGVLLLNKNGKEDFSLKREQMAITEKQKYISFFTSWIIILFIASNLYEAIGYFSIWENF